MSEADQHLAKLFMEGILATTDKNRQLAEAAIAQLSDSQLHEILDEQANSVAVLMQHVSGNLKSRWTNVLTEDGEKPDRNRDAEFIDQQSSRRKLVEDWTAAFTLFEQTLRGLAVSDWQRFVRIRGTDTPLTTAVLRSVGHTCYHIGQIVQSARSLCGDRWRTLTIPRGKSAEYNRLIWGQSDASHS